jgi:hypothetical protein
MPKSESGFAKDLRHRVREMIPDHPAAEKMQRTARLWGRRLLGKSRATAESTNLLPLLIQVLAAFSKSGTEFLEEEIDSSLGFLRYDYP